MKQQFIVYEHWLNDKCFYVGSGTVDRMRYTDKTHRRNKNYHAFIGGRYKDVKKKIVKYFDTREEAADFEREHTKQLRENHPLVNIKNGNEPTNEWVRDNLIGRKHSDATKLKMSEKAKGRKKSEEEIKKISDARKKYIGKNHPQAKTIKASYKNENFIFYTQKEMTEFFTEKYGLGKKAVAAFVNGKEGKISKLGWILLETNKNNIANSSKC